MATEQSAPRPDGIPYSMHRCAERLHASMHWRVALSLRYLPRAELCAFPSPPTLTTMEGSLEALRPLTLGNCKILTTAICGGLHWYAMRCVHPSQRCISARQMTDNFFDIGTAALTHVACAPQESGFFFLTDFAAAYPSVNHSWIFHVLKNTELPEFICRFLRRIYNDSTTRPVLHGQTRDARLSGERFLVCDGFRPYLSLGPGRNHSKEPCRPGLSAAGSVRVC